MNIKSREQFIKENYLVEAKSKEKGTKEVEASKPKTSGEDRFFQVYVAKDDSGKKRSIKVVATDEAKAKKQVADFLLAPLTAIEKVKDLGPVLKESFESDSDDFGIEPKKSYGFVDRTLQKGAKTAARATTALFGKQKAELEKFVDFIVGQLRGETITVDKIVEILKASGALRYSLTNNMGNKPAVELDVVENDNMIIGFAEYIYSVLDERGLTEPAFEEDEDEDDYEEDSFDEEEYLEESKRNAKRKPIIKNNRRK